MLAEGDNTIKPDRRNRTFGKALKNFLISAYLIVFDFFGLCLVFSLSHFIANLLGISGSGRHVLSLWYIFFFFVILAGYEGLYTKRFVFWHDIQRLVKSLTVALILLLLALLLYRRMDWPTFAEIVFFWAIGVLLLSILKLIAKRILFRFQWAMENVIILGADEAGKEIGKSLVNSRHCGYRIIAFLDDDPALYGKEVSIGVKKYPVIGKISNCRNVLRNLDIGTVVIAMPSLPHQKLIELYTDLQKFPVMVLFVRDLKGVGLLNIDLFNIFMEPLLIVGIHNNLKSAYNVVLKRIFDITFAFLLLPFIIAASFLIALAIKLDSSGPIFYVRDMIGYKCKTFRMFKFRTMRVDADERLAKILESDPKAAEEWHKYFKLKNDPRITAVGSFLRRWSLDELPQIVNVLLGDMSLVGPRPVTWEEIHEYYGGKNLVYYFSVKPGVTGIWQVSGRNDALYQTRVALDMWYALNWSLWLDIVICFKTFRAVLRREGAY